MRTSPVIICLFFVILSACSTDDSSNTPDDDSFFHEFESRNFDLGFSTWPYAATTSAVEDTYSFIEENSTIYSEHIDSNIPWSSWINDQVLPVEFVNDIAGRTEKKLPNSKLTVSVSLLNGLRSDLAPDYDGNTPDYLHLFDSHIEDAYVAHLTYVINALDPDILLIAIEVNELFMSNPTKWEEYKMLISKVRNRIKQDYPNLLLSESVTWHNITGNVEAVPNGYKEEILSYMNELDLVTISFYPYFRGISTTEGFQAAFDELHSTISKPIAFSETSHLSEDLSVQAFELYIAGNHIEQNQYLETLLVNAQEQDYEYIIWWAHRDYDALLATFPEDLKDLGSLWLSTGLINEDGEQKRSYSSWQAVLEK